MLTFVMPPVQGLGVQIPLRMIVYLFIYSFIYLLVPYSVVGIGKGSRKSNYYVLRIE